MKKFCCEQKRIIEVVVSALVLVLCLGNVVRANEVINPGFENDLSGWTPWLGQLAITDEAATGAKALKVGPDTGGAAQTISVIGGKTYTLTATAKVYASGFIGYVGVKNTNYNFEKFITFDSPSDFYTKSIEINVPSGVNTVDFYVWNSGGDYMVVDDLMLEVVPVEGELSQAVYVDCSLTTNGDGSQDNPWNNLASVEAYTYTGGASILLKRNTTCNGNLTPVGSGFPGNPIILGAYGTGELPIISAGNLEYAIKLMNQSYWRIENIETTGGTTFGVRITSDTVPVNYFRLRNLVVRDVISSEPMADKATGLVIVGPDASNPTSQVNDVIIDNVTAYNTNRWAGILVGAPSKWAADEDKRSNYATISNSEVYDVYGDGIILFAMNNARIESSVAYRTGIEPELTIGTPNGIWTWSCMNCVVEFNEAYENDSPGVDGGAFDIDWGNINNTYQYNYGHDNSAYCIAIFGAAPDNNERRPEETITVNSIIRYNICANNGTQDVKQNKEVEITTWNGGFIDGVQIYNNTFYTHNGVLNSVFYSGGFSGTLPRFFKNNIIYSMSENPRGIAPTGLDSDYNLWYHTGGQWDSSEPNSVHANPKFIGAINTDDGVPAIQFQLMPDSPAIDAGVDICDDIANCSIGVRDFFGNPLQGVDKYDIGAHEYTVKNKVEGDWDKDGDVDIEDIRALTKAIQQGVSVDPSFDINNDNVINILDVKALMNQCTRTRCAV